MRRRAEDIGFKRGRRKRMSPQMKHGYRRGSRKVNRQTPMKRTLRSKKIQQRRRKRQLRTLRKEWVGHRVPNRNYQYYQPRPAKKFSPRLLNLNQNHPLTVHQPYFYQMLPHQHFHRVYPAQKPVMFWDKGHQNWGGKADMLPWQMPYTQNLHSHDDWWWRMMK